MVQCLPAQCQLVSPVSTQIGPRTRRLTCNAARISHSRRGLGLAVRAESKSASTSTVEPAGPAPTEEVTLTPTAPPSKSLINEENILSAISGRNIIVEDHYGRLRVNPEASSSEIVKAYQERCAEVRQQNLGESEAQEILNKLKDSVDLLTSEEERRLYDWCLLRKATHTVDYAWPYEADLTQRLQDPTTLVAHVHTYLLDKISTERN
ncbi:NAD(P)H-quinone oxidoreductase subunit U, chloroplastic isoform X2 [Physcomitrium patens]|uniref:NAD(P)H-quinone oxidoreductase subunit U, chloroplastic isoform X2 n=1 Tax=Physcomitrium patens TaxID=3218 RepID=UPI000D157743|nr:NAD(P)H-quinone oxidoreductase subunit U, chloroplastic-like isoform X2 [Physcomitrium patens]|eukprot:XP_024390025.1 NAD(P)H-quinone oxidoreductase subunit U, chloroplastic-like isoform X2 [Physcomitrella patens]